MRRGRQKKAARTHERRQLEEITVEAANAVRQRFGGKAPSAEDAHSTVDISAGFRRRRAPNAGDPRQVPVVWRIRPACPRCSSSLDGFE